MINASLKSQSAASPDIPGGRMTRRLPIFVFALLVAAIGVALAQDKGTVDPKPLPPLSNPKDPKLPAKELFGRALTAANLPPHPVGFYAKGCMAGAEALPMTGDTWQVMRPSRNRYWGLPDLVALVKRLSVKAKRDAGWNGILVGDMSQPRGGPMLTGHASHQVGLDADIWLTPMPDHVLSRQEREEMSAVMMVREDRLDIDPKVWTPTHLDVIRDAAQEPQVQRIFVNAAIKKALCREAKGDRSWLSKIRPTYGHDYHFHIRMKCPAGSTNCEAQPPPNEDEGCKASDLAFWFKDSIIHPKLPEKPPEPRRGPTLAQLPAECKQVLNAP
jgi:penicillin-insensitive murein endopeptidase